MTVKKKKKLYEGKSKTLYETEHAEHLVLSFRDEPPGGNGVKAGVIANKGVINNQVSAVLFRFLESYNIPTHFVAAAGKDGMVIRHLEMVPLMLVVHNVATVALAKQLAVKEGTALEKTVMEYHFKDAARSSPAGSTNDLLSAGIVRADELRQINRLATKVNVVLAAFFKRRELILQNLKLEFGRYRNRLLLGDELSLDTCSLAEAKTGERLTPPRHRSDPATIEKLYQELGQRLLAASA